MKRPLFILAALATTVLVARPALAQGSPASAPKQQKLYKVLEIKGADKVQDFQHDVQVMQAERQNLAELQTALGKEKNAQKKKELQAKLDAAMKKFEADNQAMEKGYHFSMARDYTMQVDAITVYLNLTDEEAAKIEQAQKAEQAKAKK